MGIGVESSELYSLLANPGAKGLITGLYTSIIVKSSRIAAILIFQLLKKTLNSRKDISSFTAFQKEKPLVPGFLVYNKKSNGALIVWYEGYLKCIPL